MATMKKQIQEPIIFDFSIPDSTDKERAVLGDAISSPELLDEFILPFVHREFFTNDLRLKIWDTIMQKHRAGDSVDLISMTGTIGNDITGEIFPYFNEAGMSCKSHAQELRKVAAKRRSFFAMAEFLEKVNDSKTTEDDLIIALEPFNHRIEGPAPLQGERPLVDVVAEVKDNIKKTEEAIQAGKNLRVTTGFQYMDETLNGGLKSGQLIVLAARPSVGKTALMLQMAKGAAAAGNPVQIFSLEMQADELAERLIYSTGEVRPYDVNHGEVNPDAFERAELQLNPLPIYINDFSRSLDEIVSRLTQAVKKGRCKAAYIDYLGLLNDALNFGSAKLYQVIARITGTLKTVAKRLEIPIVLLCQLNREAAREGRAPELFDLRDSGSIEQDADIVMMLENHISDMGMLVVWLRKHRAGKKEVAFRFIPNDTYSAFQEALPATPEQMRELVVAGKEAAKQSTKEPPAPTPAPAPVQSYYEPESKDDDDNLFF